MAIPQNGRVPAAMLVEVEPGAYLERATAAAYLRADRDSGGILRIAAKAGAYRDWDTQYAMKHGIPSYSHWNLDPRLAVTIANAGYSTHGLGTRLDLAVNGGREWADRNLQRYGFIKEYGAADPGHWQYLHPTFASSAPAGGDTDPLPVLLGRNRPMLIAISSAPGVSGNWLLAPGYVHWFTGEEWGQVGGPLQESGVKIVNYGTNRRAFDVAVESFIKPHPPYNLLAPLLDDETKILAAVRSVAAGGGSIDLRPVLDALADNFEQLQDAVAGLPEDIRAKFHTVFAS